MQKQLYKIILSALLLLYIPTQSYACSDTTLCNVEGGDYYLKLPADPDNIKGAMVFIHGFGGSGQGILNNSEVTKNLSERGYALIAPNGMKMDGQTGHSWSFYPKVAYRRDEIPFLKAVRDDAMKRLDLNSDKMLMAGFSIGGSMTTYFACEEPDAFHAYAPIGGSFWRPHPTQCNGPLRLFHTHGWSDGTVPLEGRVLRGADINSENGLVQGDVFHSMEILRYNNHCYQSKADNFIITENFWRRSWSQCAPNSALEIALNPDGHIIPQGWTNMILDWYEAL